MTRGLAAAGLVAVVLIGAAAACGGSGSTVEPQSSAQAQATNVRRTAVAEVQRIIANNPEPTPTPAPTEPPRPTCPGAIWWYEARSHLGEARAVQGAVIATRPVPDGSALLEIGQPYPDPTGLAVLMPASGEPIAKGKMVCITGRITNVEGRPTMQVRDPSSIVVLN